MKNIIKITGQDGMKTLLIASGNVGKLREIEAILADRKMELGLHVLLPAQAGVQLTVEEDGSSYAENAAKKALAYARASGLLTLADDSGLSVDALDGQPGLYSARYAPWPNATDADRRHYLLENLQGKPRPWKAHFHCTVALSTPEGGLSFAEGICPGEVIPEERGSGGFGYDPIFYLSDLGCTMAELSMEQKNTRSHRALAVQAALPMLMKLLDA